MKTIELSEELMIEDCINYINMMKHIDSFILPNWFIKFREVIGRDKLDEEVEKRTARQNGH